MSARTANESPLAWVWLVGATAAFTRLLWLAWNGQLGLQALGLLAASLRWS